MDSDECVPKPDLDDDLVFGGEVSEILKEIVDKVCMDEQLTVRPVPKIQDPIVTQHFITPSKTRKKAKQSKKALYCTMRPFILLVFLVKSQPHLLN